MLSPSDCPFYAGAAISDPRFFVGRQESLKIIDARLTGVLPTSINVVGRHRTGKSSLLLHFVRTYRQRVSNPDQFVVVYLSLQNAACDTQAKFYGSIAQLLEFNLPSQQRQLQRMLRQKMRQKKWQTDTFNKLIEAFKPQDILPVLCIDNFEELLERQEQFPNGFYDNLRYLVSNNYLMVIMASCEMLDIYSQTKQITSDFFNVFQTISLNHGLTREEAQTLVGFKNSAGQGLSPDLQQKALQWGKNQPLLLQLAGQTLWKMQVERKSLRWADKEFKTQAKRFYFQPKSLLLLIPYKIIIQLGKGIFWFTKNRKEMQNFWTGLIFLAVVSVILLAFFFGLIDFTQIKSLFQKPPVKLSP